MKTTSSKGQSKLKTSAWRLFSLRFLGLSIADSFFWHFRLVALTGLLCCLPHLEDNILNVHYALLAPKAFAFIPNSTKRPSGLSRCEKGQDKYTAQPPLFWVVFENKAKVPGSEGAIVRYFYQYKITQGLSLVPGSWDNYLHQKVLSHLYVASMNFLRSPKSAGVSRDISIELDRVKYSADRAPTFSDFWYSLNENN